MGRRELKLSLRTRCPETARRLGAEAQLRVETLFSYLRRTPNLLPDEIQTAIRIFYYGQLEADLRERMDPRPRKRGESGYQQLALDELEAETIKALADRDFATAQFYLRDETLSSLPEADAAAENHGVLCHGTLRAVLEVIRRVKEREAGDWSGEPRDPLLRIPATPVHTPTIPAMPRTIEAVRAPDVTMPELIDLYLAEKLKVFGRNKSESAAAKYENDVRPSLDWFGEYFNGFKAPGAYKKSDFVSYKNGLMSVPTNFRKIFPGASILEAIELNKTAGKPTLSAVTINKKLVHIKSFFEWLHANDYIPTNPAKDVRLHKSTKSSRRSKRHPFTTNDLTAIFSAKPFQEPWSTKNAKRTSAATADHAFWLPLLALYTGARLAEIAQLHCSDVVEREGILLIHITEKLNGRSADAETRKSLKNAASERYVPVHPELLALGFGKFVDQMKATKSIRLFPACKRGADGQFSPFTKSFAYSISRLGVKTDKMKTFHSFRHGFEDAMREAGIGEAVACRLTGRTDNHSAAGYGSGHSPRRLFEEISKVRYEGLDLSHLSVPPLTYR